MSKPNKNEAEILAKLGIKNLNPMQKEAQLAMDSPGDVVLLSPTGTGKTVAFLLPIIKRLKKDSDEIQALIIVPSRELAIQIEQVVRDMGAGFKVNAVYGGRSGSKDRLDLKHRPSILIGTPGRIADHLRRQAFHSKNIETLVLDEFDKSAEIGFETEMKEILDALKNVNKRILTSATYGVEIPDFVGLHQPTFVNYLKEESNKLLIKKVLSPTKDKLDTLLKLINQFDQQNGIIFCNFKDSIQRVGAFLSENNVSFGSFYGGMEQGDRERALIKFRNGTHQLLVATDLAARGIDVPELSFIIHYHLPLKKEEFIHRNGRTARMNSHGNAYVIHYEKEKLPDYIGDLRIQKLKNSSSRKASEWTTLFVSGGRKDKISKGDIAGLFFKQGNLDNGDLGTIELKNDCAFVAVKTDRVKSVLPRINNTRLKKKKVRITII